MKTTVIGTCLWVFTFAPAFTADLVLFSSGNAFAQATPSENPAPPLTLSEAIQTAAKENPSAMSAAYQVEASAAQVTQARSGLLPQVSLSETYNRTNNPMWAFGTKLNQEVISAADFNPVVLNDPDTIDNFATSVAVNWSLFDPGQSWIPWQQAKWNHEAARLRATRTRQEIIARVAVAYSGQLLAREHLRVVNQSLETARAHLKLVRDRFKSGFVVKSDLLRAELRIAELIQTRIQAESNLAIAHARLKAAMGVRMENNYNLITPLDKGSRIEDPLEDWVSTAVSRRPDLRAMGLLAKAAQDEIKKSRFAHLPSIHLLGNYEMNTEDFSDSGDNYTLGAVLQLNLFSGSRLSAKTREAEAGLGNIQAMERALTNNIRVEIRQAYSRAQSAWNRIQVAAASIAQAEEGLRIVRNRYQSGLITIVGLLDAEVALQQSRMNHFRALHDHKTATAQLSLACGTIDVDFK